VAAVNQRAGQQLGVAVVLDAHLAQHLTDDDFDVLVRHGGGTGLAIGSLVEADELEEINQRIRVSGGSPAIARDLKPASVKRVLLGITRASLATDSFLSAASCCLNDGRFRNAGNDDERDAEYNNANELLILFYHETIAPIFMYLFKKRRRGASLRRFLSVRMRD